MRATSEIATLELVPVREARDETFLTVLIY